MFANNTTINITYQLPDWISTPLSNVCKLDLVILPLLLFLSATLTLPNLLFLFIGKVPSSLPKGYVVPAFTRHARFLPKLSANKFQYNTLYLAVRLDALEQHKLDKSLAFAWKGNHFEPEWQDESRLAQNKLVRSGSTILATKLGLPSTTSKPSLEEWKQSMRRSERRERRSKQEKRRRNDAMTWSLTGLHPSSYMRNHFPWIKSEPVSASGGHVKGLSEEHGKWLEGSVLLKLAYELRERGHLTSGPQDQVDSGSSWNQQLGQVWTVTMPSFMGFTGINPLTLHYCYRPSKEVSLTKDSVRTRPEEAADTLGEFWLVVLEVHNTFSERHIYVLESGVDEDNSEAHRRAQYQHQWTFPRSFHVSPFNDRGGLYRLLLSEPFSKDTAEPFKLSIRLLLLVKSETRSACSGSWQLEKKLMASLDSYPTTHVRRSLPLTAVSLYAAILRQPFDLLLTTARILYQAGRLHFVKKLDAFRRPDMVQAEETVVGGTLNFDGIGLPPPINVIETHRAKQVDGEPQKTVTWAGLHYPTQASTEHSAKAQLAKFAKMRIDHLSKAGKRWSFCVTSTDPADPGLLISQSQEHDKELVLYTRSGSVYIDLLQLPTVQLSLLVGSIIGRRWGVSDLGLFKEFFEADEKEAEQAGRIASRIRSSYMQWLVRHAATNLGTIEERIVKSLSDSGFYSPKAKQALDQAGTSWSVTLSLACGYAMAVMEERLLALLGARYVAGTEPWLELARGVQWLKAQQRAKAVGPTWDLKLGSVRRHEIES